ncbi:hypothetical protein NLI96_g4059 [Meripilus lineatus]|uniref:Cytochrome P450 n=1 Tax=Meripilus lineatus TaxID=2056292 RepID=A0AAD5YG18_9APHY|nr:hypothetical protein NLI96_g4059 [Physisporinus lineatus]
MPFPQCLPLIAILLLAYVFSRSLRKVPLPPGPPSDPLIGHLRLMTKPHNDATFTEWHKRYGDLIHLNVFGKNLLFINSAKVAIDLLDKRSIIYSDRPWFPVQEMIGWQDILGFLPYGEEFSRKLFQDTLSRSGVRIFEDLQLYQAQIFAKNLLRSPDRFLSHVKRFSSGIILEIAYGHRVESEDDSYLKLTENLNAVVAGLGTTGVSIVDILPILRHLPPWFPGARLHRHCHWAKSAIRDMEDIPFQAVRRKMAEGTAGVSFLSMALEKLQREDNQTEAELRRAKVASFQLYAVVRRRYAVVSINAALTHAQSTISQTISATENALFCLLLHPHVQKRAQAEIDKIIGQGRLPDFGEREALPYVNCVIHEAWNPTTPLGGLAHRAMEDDIYDGKFIPKGTTIITNTRRMAKDDTLYKSPDMFYPERFLPQPEGYGEPVFQGTFGFGQSVQEDISQKLACGSLL